MLLNFMVLLRQESCVPFRSSGTRLNNYAELEYFRFAQFPALLNLTSYQLIIFHQFQ